MLQVYTSVVFLPATCDMGWPSMSSKGRTNRPTCFFAWTTNAKAPAPCLCMPHQATRTPYLGLQLGHPIRETPAAPMREAGQSARERASAQPAASSKTNASDKHKPTRGKRKNPSARHNQHKRGRVAARPAMLPCLEKKTGEPDTACPSDHVPKNHAGLKAGRHHARSRVTERGPSQRSQP